MSGRTSVITDDEELDDDELLDDESEEQDVEGDGETETSQQPQTSPSDWENRFRGLQGTLQQRTEENRTLRAQMLGSQAMAAHAALVAQGVDPAAATQQVQGVLAAELLKLKSDEITTQQQGLEEGARVMTAQHLATKYSIPLDSKEFARLAQVRDPEDMTTLAEVMGKSFTSRTKTNARVKRARQNADKFGSANPVGAVKREKAKSLAEAAERFAKIRID